MLATLTKEKTHSYVKRVSDFLGNLGNQGLFLFSKFNNKLSRREEELGQYLVCTEEQFVAERASLLQD